MTFRGRPEFPPLVAAVRAGDAAAVDALWDLLEDCQATTADVMTLYAAPPEWWQDHGPALNAGETYYVMATGPETGRIKQVTPPAEDDSLRPVLACWADRHGPPGRGACVRSFEVEPPARGEPGWGVRYYGGGFIACRTEAVARRLLKRRVLGIFAEVRVPCPADGERGCPADRLSPFGVRFCGRCGGSGAVAPAGLIPPEPDARSLATYVNVPNGVLDPPPEDAP